MRYMTIFMLILIVCTSSVQAWDVNTHRGIDQVALGGQVVNLENFINNAQNYTPGVESPVIHGHRLPPEPDPKINNSTLLGIDSNDNGVRDDVERWIYDRYDNYYPCEQGIKKIVVDGREKLMLTGKEVKQRVMITCSETLTAYHPIVREIAMQFARAAQIVIQEPEKALETINYMHAAVDCNGYFQSSAKYQDEPILIDHYMFSDEFKNIQFNTAMRVRAFSEYNMALSGGVYSSSIDMREDRKSCDFNVTKLLEAQ